MGKIKNIVIDAEYFADVYLHKIKIKINIINWLFINKKQLRNRFIINYYKRKGLK